MHGTLKASATGQYAAYLPNSSGGRRERSGVVDRGWTRRDVEKAAAA